MTSRLIILFPFLALLCSVFAWLYPHWFTAYKSAIVPLLSVVMFGMGLTLTLSDFKRVIERPAIIGLGVVLQYLLMPLLAWMVGSLLRLDPLLLAGMILVGTSPGGTASNVICYLSQGDVALSITLTAVSTLLSIVMTPLLCLIYIDTSIAVPAADMLLSILKIVLAPVIAGILINHFFHHRLKTIRQTFPLISVVAIVWIIAIIVALNQSNFSSLGLVLITAVVAHNVLGLLSGYWIPRLLKCDRQTSRTLAIEVGMQNSGLAVALAIKYFAPIAALPGAMFSIWHNLSGSLLAARWRRN